MQRYIKRGCISSGVTLQHHSAIVWPYILRSVSIQTHSVSIDQPVPLSNRQRDLTPSCAIQRAIWASPYRQPSYWTVLGGGMMSQLIIHTTQRSNVPENMPEENSEHAALWWQRYLNNGKTGRITVPSLNRISKHVERHILLCTCAYKV